MEASADDVGAPDSWESADLEESVSRLMISCRKAPTPPLESFLGSDFGDELPPKAADSSLSLASYAGSAASLVSVSSDGNGGLSEEDLNQVDQFLREALQNPRERLSVLRIEQDVLRFIRDPTQQQLEFQQLPTSYLRLAVHRVAQHYNLQSMVLSDLNLPDGSGSRILVRKTSECRLPLIRLADIPTNVPQDEKNNVLKVAIKQRPQTYGTIASGSTTKSSMGNLTKSVEERKEEYSRARARIFNSSGSPGDGAGTKCEGDSSAMSDNLWQSSSSLLSPSVEENSGLEESDVNHGTRVFGDFSTVTNNVRSGRSRTDKESALARTKSNNRVAIFRDLEVDRKDPDYDRNYDRYMQRFDPGFRFSAGPYTLQPLYSPTVTYNTEFPHLGSGVHRSPQVQPLEHQPRPLAQHHIRGPWAAAPPSPTTVVYGPPEGIMSAPPYSPGHVGTHATSSMYLHSSQYTCPHPHMTYVHPQEHIHPTFGQSHQQQPEASFGLARPQ